MISFDELRPILMLLASLGCGLMAGVFFAFSTFVMKAFARLSAAEGMAAMQSVNRTVLNPVFFTVFFGTAVVCLVTLADSLLSWRTPRAGWLLAGSLFYLIGTFGVTAVFNVPLNNALAAVAPVEAEAGKLWANYQKSWTAWNHVRTAAGLAATASFVLALRK